MSSTSSPVSIAEHIRRSLELPTMIVQQYLADLSDADLLVRPFESMNHIAWQLGHLIEGENLHINQVAPDQMPRLTDGFCARHTKENAGSDRADDFLTKREYLDEMARQREATLSILEQLSDEQLMQPPPESIAYFGSTVGAVFAGEATHWMMHAGQWAVVRRKLGHPPLY